ncbi:MAG: hypothetical protein LBT25_04485 [Candidatus Symbiothrix sp.]|jgi:hypothetical protein|nr:hypothetical protein [Candidatus Symbiothrix sp.]
MENVKEKLSTLQKIDNAGMKTIKGGKTLHTLTVTPQKVVLRAAGAFDSQDGDDGDDGIKND